MGPRAQSRPGLWTEKPNPHWQMTLTFASDTQTPRGLRSTFPLSLWKGISSTSLRHLQQTFKHLQCDFKINIFIIWDPGNFQDIEQLMEGKRLVEGDKKIQFVSFLFSFRKKMLLCLPCRLPGERSVCRNVGEIWDSENFGILGKGISEYLRIPLITFYCHKSVL